MSKAILHISDNDLENDFGLCGEEWDGLGPNDSIEYFDGFEDLGLDPKIEEICEECKKHPDYILKVLADV